MKLADILPKLKQLNANSLENEYTDGLNAIDIKINHLKKDDLVGLMQVANIAFHQLQDDSRQLKQGDGFVLLKSHNKNKSDHAFLATVINKAALVLSEIDPKTLDLEAMGVDGASVPIAYVPNIRQFLGTLAALMWQAKKALPLPNIIAVTGTNGKTTISQLSAELIAVSQRVAVMGTAGNGILPTLTPSTHTTLQAMEMHQAIYEFAKEQVAVIALEASSHGLHQWRLQGVPIQVAVFSNLSRDHLDYHGDMSDYAKSKAMLFDKRIFSTLQYAIINIDDDGADLMQNTAKNSGVKRLTYSLSDKMANFFAKDIRPSLTGTAFTLVVNLPSADTTTSQTQQWQVTSPLLGRFNVANLLASMAATYAIGIDLPTIVARVPNLQGAKGRMMQVASKTGCFIVDYAHTPDALIQVLKSLKTHCTGKLWAVFGCGGDRDKGKRALMTQAGLLWADRLVLTADNPRSEDPKAILADMQVGLSCQDHYKIHLEPDRRQAIDYAVANAGAEDIVLIAGKGHETYQEINGVRYDFDDRLVLQQALITHGKA